MTSIPIDVKATASYNTSDTVAFVRKLVFKKAKINRKRQELQAHLHLMADVDADDDLFGSKLFNLTCEIYLIVNLKQEHFNQIDRDGFANVGAELYLLTDTIESFEFQSFNLSERDIQIPLHENSIIRKQIERKIENVTFSLSIIKREA